MGRFATTAELYEQYRPPYPAEFFQAVAQKLALSRQHALIDLGTGPGLLALSPQTPVVLLTGWGHRLLATRDVPEHVDRVISKPPKVSDLRQVIRDLA